MCSLGGFNRSDSMRLKILKECLGHEIRDFFKQLRRPRCVERSMGNHWTTGVLGLWCSCRDRASCTGVPAAADYRWEAGATPSRCLPKGPLPFQACPLRARHPAFFFDAPPLCCEGWG